MRLPSQLKEGLINKDGSSEESSEEESSGEEASQDEVEMHPNFKSALMQSNMEIKKKVKYKGCKKYLHRCDLWILRPVLIYKYERNMMRQSTNFYKIFKDNAGELEDEFREKDKRQSKTMMGIKFGSESDRIGFKKYRKKQYKEDSGSH